MSLCLYSFRRKSEACVRSMTSGICSTMASTVWRMATETSPLEYRIPRTCRTMWYSSLRKRRAHNTSDPQHINAIRLSQSHAARGERSAMSAERKRIKRRKRPFARNSASQATRTLMTRLTRMMRMMRMRMRMMTLTVPRTETLSFYN